MTPDRLARFARHIVLPEIGGSGQVALGEAHVVLIGCGGIGSPALQYLAAAGIGQLTLIDSDVVEESNLQRQTIFTPADVGKAKAEAAAAWIARFDPALTVTAHTTRITAQNAQSLIARQIIKTDPRMRINHPKGLCLVSEIKKTQCQNAVLEHIGKIAGMKGVAVIHDRAPLNRSRPDAAA